MYKTTRELKDAVEARIDVEQRNQIIQILSRQGALDEQTTDKLEQLMREVEKREARKENTGQFAQTGARQPMLDTSGAPLLSVPNVPAEEKPPLHPRDPAQPAIKEHQATREISSREEFAELERKNLEMAQALEQLTKEREHQDSTRIPQRDDLHSDELAYRIHHVTSRFNNEESSWIRVYWPLLAVVILAGLAVWAFFTFSPLWSTL